MKQLKQFFLLGCLLLSSASIAQVKIGNNPTSVDPSAVFEIESTSKGVLVSRMTNAQRDAIATPANGLLIFNLSNNNFEVYKTSCACWVTVTDGGNTPASNVVNTPPTVASLNYTGKAIVGEAYTINYIYFDAQNDVEGLTNFQWQIASTSAGTDAANISGATAASYTPVAGNAGLWIRGSVTPRAATGVLNGQQTFGSWIRVDASTIPTANNLTVSGTAAQGSVLTANYNFVGGTGVENTNPTAGTSFEWQTATTNTGVGIATAPLYDNLSFSNTFTPQVDLLGRFVRVGVRARDNAGLQATNFVFSPWVGPITVATEQAPSASNLSISPAPALNLTVTGSYTYNDVNNDPEGATTFQWYRADDVNGLNQAAISGANATTYTVVSADINKFIGFGVTPVAQTGTTNGTQVILYHPTSVLPLAEFIFTASAIRQLPFFAVNRAMNAQNAIQVEINVTTTGGIVFSSTTVNGYSFAANYTATTTGNQWVTLTASGTQTAYNAAGNAFTLTGVGSNTDNKSITIFNSITGAGLTAYSNGGSQNETFNNNGTCQNAIISAGHTLGTCSGTITTSAKTYDLVLINGQCWMVQNAVELPTTPCANAINTGCNTWLATSPGDIGSWGYYNTVTINGTIGWGTTEPAANEGLLYQWSAAMNGSTTERAQGVCPAGWHIPSDCEWMYLEHGQGMAIAQQTTNNTWRNTTGEGNKLRAVGGSWNNSSGFTALLTGRREINGSFNNRSAQGVWWSSSETSSTGAHRRTLENSQAGVFRQQVSKANGFSVRCLKD